MTTHPFGEALQQPDETGCPLSERERDCLTLIAQGRTDAETAALLGLSIHTVRSLLLSARRKLGARNSTAACVRAVVKGYISP